MKGLPGTITVLRDGGYTDPEILRWLFADDDSLPGTPIASLQGRPAPGGQAPRPGDGLLTLPLPGRAAQPRARARSAAASRGRATAARLRFGTATRRCSTS